MRESKPLDTVQTYSVLPSGEVLAVDVSRDSRGPVPWLWDAASELWYVPVGDERSDIIRGVDRYESVLAADPRRAADLRRRADAKAEPGQVSPTPPDAPKHPESAQNRHESTPEHSLAIGAV